MAVRKQAAWMKKLNGRIFEVLHDDWSTPSLMAQHPRFEEMDVSRGQIRKRCQMLADAGLLDRQHEDIYEITTWGQLYLQGEVDAQNQPRLRRSRVR